jgi:hypothetical protein
MVFKLVSAVLRNSYHGGIAAEIHFWVNHPSRFEAFDSLAFRRIRIILLVSGLTADGFSQQSGSQVWPHVE